MERYKRKLQPPEAKARTKWATINFNSAPVSLVDAERWLCKQFVESFQEENPDIDFSSLTVLRGVFSRKIQSRKAIYSVEDSSLKSKRSTRRRPDCMARRS